MERYFKNQQGLAALPTVVTLAVIVLLIGLGLTSGGFIENIISVSQSQSLKSFYIAESGIEDVLIKLARNKNFSGSYSPPIVSPPDTLNISASGTYPKSVTSTAIVYNKRRGIEATINIDANQYGKLALSSWQEAD